MSTRESAAQELLGQIPQRTAISGVASRLLSFLTSGETPVGTRLPPERELATSLGVGRSAIRGALAALEILGIIEVRPGSGSYVAGTTSELLPQTLTWGMLVNPDSTEDLIQIRTQLEVLAAKLAAAKRTEEDLVYLDSCVADLKAAGADVQAFVTADFRFHDRIATIADNGILKQMLSTLRSLLRLWVDRAVRYGQQMTQTIDDHATVLEAIRAGDPAAAGAAMDAHMATAANRLRSFGEKDTDKAS